MKTKRKMMIVTVTDKHTSGMHCSVLKKRAGSGEVKRATATKIRTSCIYCSVYKQHESRALLFAFTALRNSWHADRITCGHNIKNIEMKIQRKMWYQNYVKEKRTSYGQVKKKMNIFSSSYPQNFANRSFTDFAFRTSASDTRTC